MKKLVSLILVVLLLCMALPAFAEEDVTGDWYLKTMKMGDQEYDAASIGYTITLTLNGDGTVAMTMPGEEASVGTWTLAGDKFTMTVDDTAMEGTVSEGVMTLVEDGGEMIFTREVVSAIEMAEVKAAEAVEEFYGDWTCAYVEVENITMGASAAGVGTPSMTVYETGLTFSDEEEGMLFLMLSLSKMEPPVFEEGKLTFKAAADALNPDLDMTIELLEDGMLKLTMLDDSHIALYFTPAESAAGEG